jgi:hypothetical protein
MIHRIIASFAFVAILLGLANDGRMAVAAATPTLRQELLKANANWSPLEISSFPKSDGQPDPDTVILNEILPFSVGGSPCKPLMAVAGLAYVNQQGTFKGNNGQVGFDPSVPAEQGTTTAGQKLTVCRAFLTRGQLPASVPQLDPKAVASFCTAGPCGAGLPVSVGPNSFQFIPTLGSPCATWTLPAGYVLSYAKGATDETVVVGPKKTTPKLWFGTCPTIWIFRIA